MGDTTEVKCAVCLEKAHRYTCPRCNIRYCSVACYKHSKHADCSELFYRDCFMTELKNQKVSDAEKQAIVEVIKKVEEDNPIIDQLDEENNILSLDERLRGMDLNNLTDDSADDLWSKLTAQEQEEFKQMIQHGFVDRNKDFAQAWKPWWLFHTPGLITLLDKEVETFKQDTKLPKPIKISPISSDKTLSPFIGFNLMNVLYSYVFFQRMFNGCGPSDFDREFCELCLASSTVLGSDATFNSTETALCECASKCTTAARGQNMHVSRQMSIECVGGVSHLLAGPGPDTPARYTICALSDMHTAFRRFRKSLRRDVTGSESSSSGFEESAKLQKRLFAVVKKLEFFASWCSSFTFQLPLLSVESSEMYRKRTEEMKRDVVVEEAVTERLSSLENVPQSGESLIVELD